LFWDLLWASLFGVLIGMALWLVLRRGGRARKTHKAALVLIPAALGAGSWAVLAPAGASVSAVLFGDAAPPAHAVAVVEASGEKVLWTDISQEVWAVGGSGGQPTDLYGQRAVFVSPSFPPDNCLNRVEFKA